MACCERRAILPRLSLTLVWHWVHSFGFRLVKLFLYFHFSSILIFSVDFYMIAFRRRRFVQEKHNDQIYFSWVTWASHFQFTLKHFLMLHYFGEIGSHWSTPRFILKSAINILPKPVHSYRLSLLGIYNPSMGCRYIIG